MSNLTRLRPSGRWASTSNLMRRSRRNSDNCKLHDDIIRIICLHSKSPPRARNEGDGHGTYGQPTLLALMRVSKRFYAIAAPILYTDIVTDDITRLLREIIHPARRPLFGHAEPCRKLNLLQHCRHLSLEPTRDLYVSPEWDVYAPRRKQRPWTKLDERERMYIKVEQMRYDILTLFYDQGGLARIFPALETLSICAHSANPGSDTLESRLYSSEAENLRAEADRMLCTARAPVRCYTAHRGYPFKLFSEEVLDRSIRNEVADLPRPPVANQVHFIHVNDIEYRWPVAYGVKTVYMYDHTAVTDERLSLMGIYILIGALVKLVQTHRPRHRSPKPGRDAVDIHIRIPRVSCPLSKGHHPLDDAGPFDQEEVDRILAEVLERFGDPVEIGDRWAVTIVDGPQACPACRLPWGMSTRTGESMAMQETSAVQA